MSFLLDTVLDIATEVVDIAATKFGERKKEKNPQVEGAVKGGDAAERPKEGAPADTLGRENSA